MKKKTRISRSSWPF